MRVVASSALSWNGTGGVARSGSGVGLKIAWTPASPCAMHSLVVFGDSLSDSGNNALVIGSNAGQTISGNTYVPSQPYGSGVYSNGPVWASNAAAALGVTLQP